MSRKKYLFSKSITFLASSKLALVLVVLLIVISSFGVFLPQENSFHPQDMERWQRAHPLTTTLFMPLGFFHVFYSIPFLMVILLFAVNTLTCTLVTMLKNGNLKGFFGRGGLKRTGFVVLHISLLLIFAGGFWSAGASLDGYIVLTEGQTFSETHGDYLRISEGPLRPESHRGFVFRMNHVAVKYERKYFPVDVTVTGEFIVDGKVMNQSRIKINSPVTFQGISFTQDELGYSPRLLIRKRKENRVLVDSFVALKTFRDGVRWKYRDFLPLPFFKERVIITVIPDFTLREGKIHKNSEEAVNPLILIEMEAPDGKLVASGRAALGKTAEVGGYRFTFIDLRRWSSLRVRQDYGYPIVLVGFLLGVGAIFLRYFNDLKRWFVQPGNPSNRFKGGRIGKL